MTPKSCILPLLTWGLLVACSQQGEGERCLRSNLDADCETGYICVAADQLEQSYSSGDGKISDYAADRCCPPDELHYSDARCKRKTVVSTNNASGGAATSSGGETAVSAAGSGNATGGLGGAGGTLGTSNEGGSGGGSAGASQAIAGSGSLGEAGTAGSAN